jgi:4-oxalocrotonate tautomerase
MCVRTAGQSMSGISNPAGIKEDDVPLIEIKLMEGVYTAPQKREMVQRLSEAMLEIVGESMREVTWCVVEEVRSGNWGIGGQPLTADDVRALAS